MRWEGGKRRWIKNCFYGILDRFFEESDVKDGIFGNNFNLIFDMYMGGDLMVNVFNLFRYFVKNFGRFGKSKKYIG